MKLILYEWKKLWKNASVLKVVFFFLLLSGIVFWGEVEKDRKWTPTYLEMHETIDTMSAKEAENWLEKEREQFRVRENTEEGDAFFRAAKCIEQEIEAMGEYDDYREQIQNRYEQNQSISIFAEKSELAYMRKIALRYEELSVKAPMMLQPYEGIQRFLESYTSDAVAVVLLLYLVSVVFLQEEKSGKAEFACTMVKGRRTLFFAKAVTVYGSMVLYLLIIYLLNLVMADVVYGTGSFSAAVQSVPGLYAVPYAWTIGQYLFFYFCMKALSVLLLTAIAIFLAKWRASEVQVFFLLVLLMGSSVWAGSYFMGDGPSSILRIWNIWSMLRGTSVIRTYELIRFGDVTLDAAWGIPVILTAAGFFLFAAGFGTWKKRKRRNWMQRRKTKKPHGVFYYEMKKLWIHQGGMLLFAVCILIQSITVWRYGDYIGQDEFYYQKYVDALGEHITDETDTKIAAEEQRLQKLEEELAVTEDAIVSMRLMNELERRGGFQKYVSRVHTLQEEEKEEILLKDTQYRLLFEQTEVSRILVMLLSVSFAFLIPAMFHKEKDSGVEILQKTSVHGGRKLWCAKMTALLLYSIPLLLAAAGMMFGRVSSRYHLRWNAPAECLGIYWDSGIHQSIRTLWISGVAIQCVMAAVTVILLSACAKRVKNQYVMAGVLIGGCVVPTVLTPYSPVGFLSWVHDFFFVFTVRSFMIIGIGAAAVATSGVIVWREMKRG